MLALKELVWLTPSPVLMLTDVLEVGRKNAHACKFCLQELSFFPIL